MAESVCTVSAKGDVELTDIDTDVEASLPIDTMRRVASVSPEETKTDRTNQKQSSLSQITGATIDKHHQDADATPSELRKEHRQALVSKTVYALALSLAICGFLGFGASTYYVPSTSHRIQNLLQYRKFRQCWRNSDELDQIAMPSKELCESLSYISIICDVLWLLCVVSYKWWIDANKCKLLIIFGTMFTLALSVAIMVTYLFGLFLILESKNVCTSNREFGIYKGLELCFISSWMCIGGFVLAAIVRKIRNKYFYHYYGC